MKRLHLLILRSFIGPFVLIFIIVLFVLLMQFLWRYIDELIGKGLEFKTIGEFLLYTSATLVPMALPLSILMSSLMTFGNLGEKYELTAIKASGISLQKIMRPLVVVVIFVSFGAFFFANNVLPYANLQMRSLLYDIRQQRPELQLKPGEFNNLIDGYSIRIQDKDPNTNTMFGLQIYNHSEGKGNVSVIFADSGTMKMTPDEQNLLLTLFDGHSYNELQDMKAPEKKRSYPHRYDRFEKQEFLIELTGFDLERTDQDLFKNHYAMMNLEQLKFWSDSLENEIMKKENHVFKTLSKTNIFKKRTHKKNTNKKPGSAKISNTEKQILSTNENSDTLSGKLADKKAKTPLVEITPKEIAKKHNIQLLDSDSLFNTLTLREKSRISSNAITNARNSMNLVVNTNQSLDYTVHNLRRYEIEWHRKFTIAFACLLFLFIGAPLGAIIRKGGLGLPLVLSVLFFILSYILSLTGEKLVRESLLPDYQGMWLSSAVFAITGGFLTYQATTDSSMLNMDTYLNFLKKLFGQRYNVVDTLNIDKKEEKEEINLAKVQKIHASIFSLEESVGEMLETVKRYFRISEFIGSIFTIHNDSKIILFERYYNNTFRIIVNHPIFHKKNVRAKIYEFPSFSQNEFGDKKWKLFLRISLSCTLILIPLVALRQYIKLLFIRIKLRKIQSLLPELSSMIKMYESEQ